MLVLCDYMKWDYYTYWNQPQWFLDAMFTKIGIDSRRQETKTNKFYQGEEINSYTIIGDQYGDES